MKRATSRSDAGVLGGDSRRDVSRLPSQMYYDRGGGMGVGVPAVSRGPSVVHPHSHQQGTQGGIRWPWLQFDEPAMEEEFRLALFAHTRTSVLDLLAVQLANTAISVFQDIFLYHDNASAMQHKMPVVGAYFAVLLCLLIVRGMTQRRMQLFQQLFTCVILTVAGVLWTVYQSIDNDTLGLPSCSTAVLLYLSATVGFGRVVFPYMCVVVWSVTISHTVCVFVWRSSSERFVHALMQVLYVYLFGAVVTVGAYAFENYRRTSWVIRMRMERERDTIKEENLELREEVYNLMLGKVTNSKDELDLDLQSPGEKAIELLRSLTKQPGLPKPVFDQIKVALSYLSSSDLFRPQLQTQISARQLHLDNETQDWLFSLVDETQTRASVWLPHGPPADGDRASDTRNSNNSGSRSASTEAKGPQAPGQGQRPDLARSPSMSPQLHILDEEQKYMVMLERTDEWNFDAFEMMSVTKGRPLLFVGFFLFKKFNLLRKFAIRPNKLRNFLAAIEQGYHSDIPYHNSQHAADVTHATHFFLTKGNLVEHLSDVELIAAVVAALIHDFDHPGRTNQFHIVTQDEKALVYNDRAVLENHHCASAFRLFKRDDLNIFDKFEDAEFVEFRKLTIDMVLATDLSQHFDNLAHFNSAIGNPEEGKAVLSMDNPKTRAMVLKMALKCADVSHTCKELPLHLKWTTRIVEEFYRQGDKERELGIPISPFMDRKQPKIPKAQLGFINYLVRPMLEVWIRALGQSEQAIPCLLLLLRNRDHWLEQDAQPAAAVAAPTPPLSSSVTASTSGVPLLALNTGMPSSSESGDPLNDDAANASQAVEMTQSPSHNT